MMSSRPPPVTPVLLSVLLIGGCSGGDPTGSGPADGDPNPGAFTCALDPIYFFQTAVPKDGIPALNDPQWLDADHPIDLWFLRDADRVVGFIVEGQAYAVPHNLLWYHEIANVSLPVAGGMLDLAITFCPLTGTSMVFDRVSAGGAEFGVSGLLYQSNLVMYDRNTNESLWPQMMGQARCGLAQGTRLDLHPSMEMRWDGWLSLYPDTRVLGSPVGNIGPYDSNPYPGYTHPTSGFSFPMPPIDPRLPLKELVLGVLDSTGNSTAFPFSSLQTLASTDAVEWFFSQEGIPAVTFWDRERLAAGAYDSRVDGEQLTFHGTIEGIFDDRTGSTWTVDGRAIAGPMAGTRLDPVGDSYVAYWGAWNAFFPAVEIWGPAKP